MAAKDALQLHREFLHTRLEVRRPTVTHHHHRPPRSQVDLAHAQRRVDDAQQLVDELAALRTDLGPVMQCTLQEAQEVVAARQAAAKEQLQAAADALVKLRTHVAVARVGVQQLEAAKMLGTWTADTGNR